MRDPMDCTYPHTHLCVHECCEGCVRRMKKSPRACVRDPKESPRSPLLTCEQLGVCQNRDPKCPDCPKEKPLKLEKEPNPFLDRQNAYKQMRRLDNET